MLKPRASLRKPTCSRRLHRIVATTVALCVIVVGFGSPVAAEDWPQWRGRDRLGVWHETGILEKFPAGGLKVAWRVPVGSGYAGPAVADGRVFILDWVKKEGTRTMEGTERLLVLDEETGEKLWENSWSTGYGRIMASYAIGPRTTPSVDGDVVYVMGAVGELRALEVETGQLLWSKNFVEEYDATIPVWGTTSSPLVDGDLLIAVAGAEPNGKVIAYDKKTGDERWRALSSDYEMGYPQPVIFDIGGARQLIVWDPQYINSLDPKTGKLHWQQAFNVKGGMSVTTPVLSEGNLLVSQFYGGSMMLELSDTEAAAKLKWKGNSNSEMPDQTDGLHSLITTPIIEGDTIYGVCSYGELRALDRDTGKRLWTTDKMTRQGRWGAAFLVKNQDRYLVNNDVGELIIARFTREGYVEIDRTQLIEPTSSAGYGPRRFADADVNWSHPAYANGHIVARNDKEVLRASLEAE